MDLAGAPAGLVNVVTGKGSEIGDYLTQHRDASAVSFTGGGTGLRVAKGAGMIPLQMELGGTLLGVVFILPLILYGLAFVGQLVMRALGRPVGAYPARLALFWALLASTPLALLHGLTGGFVGPGPARDIVGVLWCVAFLWFWVSGLRAAAEEKPA